MSDKTRMVISFVFGLSAFISLGAFNGWHIAVCVYVMIWANNINRPRDM